MKIAYKKLVLPGLAMVSTGYIEYHCLIGHPLSFQTALLWTLAVQAITFMALLDMEQHYPTTLTRLALFAIMNITINAMHLGGVSVVHSTALLIAWRWLDLMLMTVGIVKVEESA